MDYLIQTEESLNRDTEIIAEALWDAQMNVLSDMMTLLENVGPRLGEAQFFHTTSRISGYQQALLDVVEIVKKRVSMHG